MPDIPAYVPVHATWDDYPTIDTPINAAGLEHIEAGLGAATDQANAALDTAVAAGSAASTAQTTGNAALVKTQNLADLPDKAASRSSLGLGTAAQQATGFFDPSGAASTAQSAAIAAAATDATTKAGNAQTAAISAAATDATNKVTAAITETVNTVATSGATQTIPDVTTATLHRITLTANCTLTFPAAVAGKSFTLVLTQDGTGSRTVTWPTVAWPGGVAPTLTTTAAKRDIITFLSADGTSWLGMIAGQNL